MATTKIWSVKNHFSRVVEYAKDPGKTANPTWSNADMQSLRDVMEYAVDDGKTEQQYFVTGVNCNSEIAREQMWMVKEQYGKTDGILAFHAYQSFAPGEVDAAIAHQIGVELAHRLWPDYQVVVATHLNTHCFHNHFVINSVSFQHGGKFNDCMKTYYRMRQISDDLCRKYGLSVVIESRGVAQHYAAWQAERDGKPTVRSAIRQDVDRAIRESMTWNAFLNNLKKQGYTIKTNVKHIAVRPPGGERFIRLRSLGDAYEPGQIRERILRQQAPQRSKPYSHTVGRVRFRGTFDFTLHKITWKSIRALYYHYLRILREAQARSPEQEPAPYFVREDLLSYQELREQVVFLHSHKLDTTEQLTAHREEAERELATLTAERKELHNEKRRVGTAPERRAALEKRTAAITLRIKTLRREIRLSDAIAVRSITIHERYTEARRIRQEERSVKDEPHRRRSRSGSTDGHHHSYRDNPDSSRSFH